MTDTMLAWHFTRDDCHLGNGDGRPIVVGGTLTVTGAPVLCRHGLHASVRLLDALSYAPGPILHREEIGDEIIEDDDKIRTVLWSLDATNILRLFARQCALDAIAVTRWRAPPVVLDYLLSGRECLRRSALDFSKSPSASAAAARDSVWAAHFAAWAAAQAAAKDAAVWDAAVWDAVRAEQDALLTELAMQAHRRGED